MNCNSNHKQTTGSQVILN